ncbi:hypothetical protein VNO77_42525 [Canavalia gladiata]|uniref:Uncharacterized protein n=1 Tax=Canavalia gladiata TaxID=3824 RepID=A0AAN9PM37_CANGL
MQTPLRCNLISKFLHRLQSVLPIIWYVNTFKPCYVLHLRVLAQYKTIVKYVKAHGVDYIALSRKIGNLVQTICLCCKVQCPEAQRSNERRACSHQWL